jgi:hypothetical protein
MNIHSKGSPHSDVWVIAEAPYPQDADKGFLFSGGYGFVFDKMMREAGIPDYYVTCRRSDLEHRGSISILENYLNQYKPPIIIPLEETGKFLCSELYKKRSSSQDEDNDESDIEKYAGSLLTSKDLKYPHYIIPSYYPDTVVKDWATRDIVVSLDLGKARSELEFYRKNGYLQPLRARELKYDMDFAETMWLLESRFAKAPLISTDIESIYPKKDSEFWPHPGYPTTLGLADSPDFGISFNMFWPVLEQTRKLWRLLHEKILCRPLLGQNFFDFDSARLDGLGFEINLDTVVDTKIRHQILWPELQHKLQFQTRQYTREPYYKDEGHRWTLKEMSSLRRYNCLDVCVTFEVYEGQEKEFDERPYLR